MKNKMYSKAYWHMLTMISRYITDYSKDKTKEIFTKEELHEVFKHINRIKTTTKLNEEEWGEYLSNIIIASLTILDIPSIMFLPSDPQGVQWTKFED